VHDALRCDEPGVAVQRIEQRRPCALVEVYARRRTARSRSAFVVALVHGSCSAATYRSMSDRLRGAIEAVTGSDSNVAPAARYLPRTVNCPGWRSEAHSFNGSLSSKLSPVSRTSEVLRIDPAIPPAGNPIDCGSMTGRCSSSKACRSR
jgi:hypothetical protein